MLRSRQKAIYAQLPPVLHYSDHDLIDPDLAVDVLYKRMLVKLDHLLNIFFAERMLKRLYHSDVDSNNDYQGDLLVTSFSVVTICLGFWTHRERFSAYTMRRNFEWFVVAYAAPAGGILSLELLRPSFTGPTHPKDARISRSSIVQQLSLLVGFLDWVRPSAPNGDLCADCKMVIRRVLDHHLNAQAPAQWGGDALPFDWAMDNQPGFNFELLDTFEWLRTDI